ncbi:uncharacterized protein LOC131956688 [Physella acuta]|uniref:uncharacterized protein LOC131956688 n=1 Tax=Physella acuta TaxID=109671 RepID=UPI0027DE0983|nr:uncharacterized protein LOC131956688 [Physella acuta]
MNQENPVFFVSGLGSKLNSDNEALAKNALLSLKQELLHYQQENKKMTDQLNCLVSLIKRSWTGDRLATVHLSKIVGLPPPPVANTEGNVARPNSTVDFASSKKIRCEQNWERLAIKLLDREYMSVQKEISDHQQRYMENRKYYMEAILQDHHNNMAHISLHRKTEPTAEEMGKMKVPQTKTQRGSLRRTQSAGSRKFLMAQDTVGQVEVSLRDLVGQPVMADSVVTDQMVNKEVKTITPTQNGYRRPFSSAHKRRMPRNMYNDPNRYNQKNLFELSDDECVQRLRPVSASILKEGDIQRSRPRLSAINSGDDISENQNQVFLTQKQERPLKYETTRPVTAKQTSAKGRRNSSTGLQRAKGENNQTNHSNVADHVTGAEQPGNPGEVNENKGESNVQGHKGDNAEDRETVKAKPPMSSKPKSGFPRRPKFIDDFSKDEETMKNIENEFMKNAMLLQKKLGISESGMVHFG